MSRGRFGSGADLSDYRFYLYLLRENCTDSLQFLVKPDNIEWSGDKYRFLTQVGVQSWDTK